MAEVIDKVLLPLGHQEEWVIAYGTKWDYLVVWEKF